MSERHDVILGAGLAGLTAAYTLQSAGEHHWVVLEQESRAGGHARSTELDGYVFDLGPHILFTKDREMELLIRDLLAGNIREQERRAWIRHHEHDTYTRFPFQAHLYGLPVSLVRDCLTDLIEAVEARARDGNRPRNYEEWMRGVFGNTIAERLMIPYAQKLWTVEPSMMDFAWIGERVPTPEVERIVLGALTDDVEQIGATAQFWSPWRGGIESLPRSLAARVSGLELGREVRRIDLRRRVVRLADGDEIAFDCLLFTLPLHALPRWVDDLPQPVRKACEGLAYQRILNINLGVDRPDVFEAHWVYFYEDEFPFHRLSFPANFSPYNVPSGKSSISIELAVPQQRDVDVDEMVEQTIAALRTTGILSSDDEIDLVDSKLISPAYVIYDLDHERNVETVLAWLREQRIWPAGRFGTWGYLNMDHAMRSGRAAAESILASRGS
jgi:protoporphyrinogen oxidase